MKRLRKMLSWHDEDGAASIEFIVTFPLLSLWFVGSFVWFDAFRSNSLTAKTAYTLSDISSRWAADDADPYVYLQDFEDLFSAHKRLLPPRIEDGWMRVSSICYNGTENRVLWSWLGDDTYAAAMADPDDDDEPRLNYLTDETIPSHIIPPMSKNDSVILTEVYATWTPLADWTGFAQTDWANRLVTRPRFRTVVPLAPGENITGYPDAHALICPDDNETGGAGGGGGGSGDGDGDPDRVLDTTPGG
ncbi:TadE/TadG family type IV pilus assembly protein [Halovulum sp. GXIMD14794]